MEKRLTAIFIFLLLSGCQTISQNDPELIRTGNTLAEDEIIARTAYENKDYVQAERAYKRLTLDMPGDALSWYKLGNIYARKNNPGEAQKAYKEALLRDPNNAKIWHNLGVVQLRKAVLSFLNVKQNSEPGSPLNVHATKLLLLFDEVIETGQDQ